MQLNTHPFMDMGVLLWDAADGMQIAPARIESPYPNGFRMAQYPDGFLELQAAYSWTCGSEGGVTWKPLPVVNVDEDGQELPK